MKTKLKLLIIIVIIRNLSYAQSVLFTPSGAKISTNAANEKVLTSDAQGKGTWQNSSNGPSGLQVLTTNQIFEILNPNTGTKVYNSETKKKLIYTGNEWIGFDTEPLLYPPMIKKKNTDSQPFDEFGNSVAMLGTTVVVGAKNAENGKGAVYVFKHTNGFWNQTAKLIANDGIANDKFGINVAIFDNIIAVRAITGSNSNAVYLFKQNNNTWTQFAKLSPNVAGPLFDNSGTFGSSIAFLKTGDNYTILISAPFGNDTKGHIFSCTASPDNNTASIVSTIVAEDGQASDYFGSALYISPSNQQLIVSAVGYNNYTGKIYFYNKSALGGWNNTANEIKTGAATNSYLGISIKGSNNHLAILDFQKISFFEWNNSQWVIHPNDTVHPVLGIPQSMSGDYLIYFTGQTFSIAKYNASNWSKITDGGNRILTKSGNINDITGGINAEGRFTVAGYNLVDGLEVNEFVFGFAGY